MQHNIFPAGKQNHRALLLALFLALVLLISLVWIFLSARPPGENWRAEIYQDGDLLYSIPLGDLSAPYRFTVTGGNGCTNEIELSPEGARICSASCPDKLCVKQGKITNSRLPITCLPNHLVVLLRSDNASASSTEPDIITY